ADAEADEEEEEEEDEDEGEDDVFVYDSILAARQHAGGWQYQVKWADGTRTWEPAANICNPEEHATLSALRVAARARDKAERDARDRADFPAYAAKLAADWEASLKVTAAAPAPAKATRAAVRTEARWTEHAVT